MAESPEITARLGLFLCDQLSASISGMTFLPEQGKNTTEIPTPGSLGIPVIKNARQIHPPHEAYMVDVHLTLQSNLNDHTPEFHSDIVRQSSNVMQRIGADRARYYPDRQIFINGLYIESLRPAQSETDINTVIVMKVACQIKYLSS